jgi:hypothetical protein
MARFTGSATAVASVMVAATPKTLVQLVTPADHIVAVTGYGIGGRGVSNTQAPGLIELVRQSDAGTSSALVPTKKQVSRAETLQTTARNLITVEPTTGDTVRSHTLHPQTDLEIRDGFGNEVEVEGGSRLGMRATFADAQTIDAYMDFEE